MGAAQEREQSPGPESAPRRAGAARLAGIHSAVEAAGFPVGVSNLYVAGLVASGRAAQPALLRQGKGSYAGGTWDTGPATVTPTITVAEVDAKKSSLLEKAEAIYDIAKEVKGLADQVQENGEEGWNDDDMIAMARQVNGVHGSVNRIADACTKLAGVESDLIASDAKAVEYLDKAIDAAEMVKTVADTKAAADAFGKEPSYETASAWADQIGDVFDKAGGFLPTGALPGFMGDYFKGLFSAPKNYIAAFKAMMNQRYKDIDAASGVSIDGVAHGKGAWEAGEGYVWEGEMTGIFIKAQMSGDHAVANGLQQYMRDHQEIGDIDLYEVNDPAVGVGLLQSQIESDPDLSEEQKRAYLDFLAST